MMIVKRQESENMNMHVPMPLIILRRNMLKFNPIVLLIVLVSCVKRDSISPVIN